MITRENNLPRLEAQYHGQHITALLDTGATHSFLNKDLIVEELPSDGKYVTLANGEDCWAEGPIYVNIEMVGRKLELPVYALQHMKEQLILGMDWMRAEEVTIDTKNQGIYFGVIQRQAAYWQSIQANQKLNPVVLTSENASPEWIPHFTGIVNDFPEVFAEGLTQPKTNLAQHEIKLKDGRPFRIRRYQFSVEKKRIIKQEVDQMLRAGVIRRSHSRFSSPIVLVTKPNGSTRFCVDFRQLNGLTEDEVSVLPPIHNILQEIGEATIFTSLDLKSGYWQVPMAKQSIPYTAFHTPEGAAYEFLVMPFGLKNAPSSFQKLMTEVLAGYVNEFVQVYLDDIVIYSRTLADHDRHLRLVLERLSMHGLRCSITKCKFGTSDLDYLGHRVTADHNEAQAKHVQRIKEFPTPRTKKEVQSFIGTANWLREYVPRFSEIAAPLTQLVGKKKFVWTPAAEEAFQNLKEALDRPLQLHRPDPNMRYVLQTDASSVGMGAVLYQVGTNGERRVVSYASAKFSKTEQKYHCNEQEIHAVVWACRKYRPLLENRRFLLRTDSRALFWLDRYKEERAKLMRYSLLLQEFTFDVEHCPGRENCLPDFLSRHPDNEVVEPIEDDRLSPPNPKEEVNPASLSNPKAKKPYKSSVPPMLVQPVTIQLQQVDGPPLSLYEQVAEAQRNSPEYAITRVRIRRLQNEDEPADLPWKRTLRDNFRVEDDLVWYRDGEERKLVVPLNYWQRVLFEYHDSIVAGHPGRDETYRAIARFYYWPAMSKQIKTYVKRCLVCASIKRGGACQANAPLRPRPPSRPWQVLSIDVMGPYPSTRTGNRFIIVLADVCTKWVEALAVPMVRPKVLVSFVEQICMRWGYPETIISDNAMSFRSNGWTRFLHKNNIDQYMTPIYHQRSNPVERRNQELKKLLRFHGGTQGEERWDETLNQALFTLRNRKNAATGMTPSKALLGTELVRAGEWHHPNVPREVRNTEEDRERRLRQIRQRQVVFDRNLFPQPRDAPVTFRIGDSVLVRNFPGVRTPLGPPWSGPHPIIKVCGNGTYEVDRNGSQMPIHIDDLRPWVPGEPWEAPETDPMCQEVPDEGDNESVTEDPVEDHAEPMVQHPESVEEGDEPVPETSMEDHADPIVQRPERIEEVNDPVSEAPDEDQVTYMAQYLREAEGNEEAEARLSRLERKVYLPIRRQSYKAVSFVSESSHDPEPTRSTQTEIRQSSLTTSPEEERPQSGGGNLVEVEVIPEESPRTKPVSAVPIVGLFP